MILLALAVGIAFTALVTVLGWNMVYFSKQSGQVTAELFFPRWLLYLSVPVSMALMTFHQAQVFVEMWQRPAAGGTPAPCSDISNPTRRRCVRWWSSIAHAGGRGSN